MCIYNAVHLQCVFTMLHIYSVSTMLHIYSIYLQCCTSTVYLQCVSYLQCCTSTMCIYNAAHLQHLSTMLHIYSVSTMCIVSTMLHIYSIYLQCCTSTVHLQCCAYLQCVSTMLHIYSACTMRHIYSVSTMLRIYNMHLRCCASTMLHIYNVYLQCYTSTMLHIYSVSTFYECFHGGRGHSKKVKWKWSRFLTSRTLGTNHFLKVDKLVGAVVKKFSNIDLGGNYGKKKVLQKTLFSLSKPPPGFAEWVVAISLYTLFSHVLHGLFYIFWRKHKDQPCGSYFIGNRCSSSNFSITHLKLRYVMLKGLKIC